MNIIVLVKTVDYIYAQTGTDIAKNYVGEDDSINMINPLDESAIEFALSIKNLISSTRIQVLSIGDSSDAKTLHKCLAVGVDQAVQITTNKSCRMDAWVRASVMAGFLRGQSVDLILAGRSSVDNNDGLTAVYLAEMLGLSQVSRVVQFELQNDCSKIVVHRMVERGNKEVLGCSLPALLTIDQAAGKLRYPSLYDVLKSEQQSLVVVPVDSLELDAEIIEMTGNLTEVKRVSKPKPKKRRLSNDSQKKSATSRLSFLMKGGSKKEKEKDSSLIQGSSDRAFIEMERILKENGNIFD